MRTRLIAALVALLATSAAMADSVILPGERGMRMCAQGERNTSTKTCLVDGDTMWLHGVKYRLADFDTPEPQTNICGGKGEVALAKRASARLLELLNGNTWTVEAFGYNDRTGTRELATIWIGGRDVGDILIEEGLARRWPNGVEFWCQ